MLRRNALQQIHGYNKYIESSWNSNQGHLVLYTNTLPTALRRSKRLANQPPPPIVS